MDSNLPVYFIRHNSTWDFPNVPNDFTQELFLQREIAIDFFWDPKWDLAGMISEIWDEDKYSRNGKTAIRYFNELNNKSGIMVAAYAGVDEMLIGEIEIGSKYLKYDSTKHPLGRLKTLKFKKDACKVVTFHDFSLPFLIAPPYGTIVRWGMGEKAVLSYLSQGDMPFDNLNMYSAWHLEVLAEEFLRRRGILSHTYYKVGKSMKAYDIVGCDHSGAPLLVQVKFDCPIKTIANFFEDVDETARKSALKPRGIFVIGKQGIKSQLPPELRANVIELAEILKEFKKEENYLSRLLTGRIFEAK